MQPQVWCVSKQYHFWLADARFGKGMSKLEGLVFSRLRARRRVRCAR